MTNPVPPKALKIMALLRDAGARDVLIVGGFVRDTILGVPSKDVDIEAYGISVDSIILALAPHFDLDVVGKSFGVVKIDNEIDVSVPRRESKIGVKHGDFKVDPDPNMSIEEAAARRDFTMNSMAMREDGTILDPFNGLKDMNEFVLRATSGAFEEDALRVLRAMQFSARFGFTMTHGTIEMCQKMKSDFQFLPKERIWEEWKKFALKGGDIFSGLNSLVHTEWIEHFPELQALMNTPQDPEWHPEGDVWIHTILVVHEATKIAEREQLDDNNRMVLFFAALCHDMGKPATTKMEGGRWRAKGHCEESANVAEIFLNRIGAPRWLIDQVKPLVAEHLIHAGGVLSERAVKRLAKRLEPSSMKMLSMLIESDMGGRDPLPKGNPFLPWLELAEKLSLGTSPPVPILKGRHMISLGVSPGPIMGVVLKEAFEAQLDGKFSDENAGVEWLKMRLSNA